MKVPRHLSSDEKREVALRSIDFIRDRTEKGKNVYGKNWAGRAGKYTKPYAKLKGTGLRPVDLTDSTKMLSAIKYMKSKSRVDELVIGFRKGSNLEGRAEGNIRGSYGNPNRRVTDKARPFLDILKKDLTSIVKEVIGERESTEETEGSIETNDEGTGLFFRR